MPKSYISISAQFPTDLAQAARVEAARRNVSRAELIRQAVAEFLRKTNKAAVQKPARVQNGN